MIGAIPADIAAGEPKPLADGAGLPAELVREFLEAGTDLLVHAVGLKPAAVMVALGRSALHQGVAAELALVVLMVGGHGVVAGRALVGL
jgi:hypothetical protein